MSRRIVTVEATFNKEAFDKALREFYKNPENLLEGSPLIQRIRLDNENDVKGHKYDWVEFDTAKQMYEPDSEKPGWKKVDMASVRLGPNVEYTKEEVMTRTLYEVYVVNIEDVEDVVVDQVVADSTDKAKMRAWAAMVTPEIGDVDKYDFFTKEIGPVREAKCGSTCDRD
jgi:hypothetical protein